MDFNKKIIVAIMSITLLSIGIFAIEANNNKELYHNQLDINKITQKRLEAQKEENYKLYNKISKLEQEIEKLKKWTSLGKFKITCYWHGEDQYGDITATGVKAKTNHTIAVDPKVIPLGSKILIDGEVYVAQDVGGAVKGKVIDVWVKHEKNSFGRKFTNVYIYKGW